MKILHIASFIGNIGDNASHSGFHNLIGQELRQKLEFNQIEIRRFYQSYSRLDKQLFDESFAKLSNKHDALLIGGGGFLDYWIKGSQTGTTLDISLEILEQIKVPIIIGSVGSLPHHDVPKENFRKFEKFLQYASNRDNLHILLRNDGSKTSLRNTFGEDLIENMPEILDHGFFYEPPKNDLVLKKIKPYVLINTTVDQLEMINKNKNLSIAEFTKQIRRVIIHLLKTTEYNIVFIPHIYKDIYGFMQILENVDDYFIRSRIQIAPYLQGNAGAETLFNLYRYSELNICMRFHANVCSLAFNQPTVGLAALPRIENVHKNLDSHNYVNLNEGMAETIIKNLTTGISKPGVESKLKEHKERTISVYRDILNGIIK
ncbi:polysaccharide pyruvyl transferase family protein [Phaeodactylibacter sp.]|uniref:polysaccharide pyruvyl transferase family protein n=1 Tax=Phaeodactylibacter sp. TaxID=1940289 RepID=UPI0025D9E45D|nr:polysaccharide pyruvyl transferase family protein [Phaeodactylibacter sp.]MCI5090788.1 polysaccharide pyruvyl transferase family protein [Phaeodactylibacter sp.]